MGPWLDRPRLNMLVGRWHALGGACHRDLSCHRRERKKARDDMSFLAWVEGPADPRPLVEVCGGGPLPCYFGMVAVCGRSTVH